MKLLPKIAIGMVLLAMLIFQFTMEPVSSALTTIEAEQYVGRVVKIFPKIGTVGVIGKIKTVHDDGYVEVEISITGPDITYIISVSDIVRIELK